MTEPTSFSTSRSTERPLTGFGRPHDLHPGQDFTTYLKNYARERPDVAALWCFGVGFILGWKLKPW